MTAASPMSTTAAGFAALGEDELALVLEFASARDVEALSVAARVVATLVVPNTPSLWRAAFCRQWEALNFPLPGVLDGSAALVLDARVHQLFDGNETESRKFQVLAHAITRVPSFADVANTRHAALYSEPQHRIKVLEQQQQRAGHRRRAARPTAFAFDGDVLGHNRTVRANAPFPIKFRVAVFATETCPPELQGKLRRSYDRYYVVGVVSSGYFEVDISAREHDHHVITRIQGDNVVAIGLVSDRFPLVGRQPGWRGRSYGYHGDDGRLFHKSGEVGGEPFGPRFSAGDTVGCGVHIDMRNNRSTVFFTKNGSVVNERLTQHDCVERTEHEWFPAIGLDTYDAVRVNFGQEPFKFSSAIGMLLAESEGSRALIWKDLAWHGISDGSEEEAVYRQAQEAGWKEDEEPMMSFILRMLERRAVLLGTEGGYGW